MVRAPCCEKMGLNKGPWTPEEDHILVAHIQRYGHENWRALPKQAGLLRCGKSCRLRWMNYLRPDIKRGNFTKEEEETIIRLHEMLGNRWSLIAARLPGRTDNEIKNVWHTHLKKLVSPNNNIPSKKSKKKMKADSRKKKEATQPITEQLDTYYDSARLLSVSPEQSSYSGNFSSSSSSSSCATESSTISVEMSNEAGAKDGSFSSEEFTEIDESFWLDALSMGDSAAPMDFTSLEIPPTTATTMTTSSDHFNLFCSSEIDDMDFWRKMFMGAGDLQALPQI